MVGTESTSGLHMQNRRWWLSEKMAADTHVLVRGVRRALPQATAGYESTWCLASASASALGIGPQLVDPSAGIQVAVPDLLNKETGFIFHI